MSFWFLLLGALGAIVGLQGWVWFRRHTRGRPREWLRLRLGWGRGVAALAKLLVVDAETLKRTQCTYREVFIPKRSGGQRRLLVPDPELKDMQRRILRCVLARWRPYPAASAYRRGKSIVDNARPHVGQAVVVKMDLVDFFTSCSAQRIEYLFRLHGWNRSAAALLARLTTSDGGLPQGAPTSPSLSNAFLVPFDIALDRHVRRFKGTYTRYADDITISFPKDYPRRIRGTIRKVRQLAHWWGLQAHIGRKSLILRRHQQQRVTGLVVNAQVNLPRRQRRLLRAIAHRQKVGKETTMSPAQLAGWKAYAAMIGRDRGKPDDRARPPIL
jgi:retron-type reverse transcriptase